MADTDGDGFRELPNGDKLVLNLQFATQGIGGEVVELVSQNWADVGIQSTVNATRQAGADQLLAQTARRAKTIFAHGTTTAEAKTGYGLEIAAELKTLEVILALTCPDRAFHLTAQRADQIGIRALRLWSEQDMDILR